MRKIYLKKNKKTSSPKISIVFEEFKEKEGIFKQKVNKIQGKVEKIRRELESAMAKGMQVIQQEAVKHMKEIAKRRLSIGFWCKYHCYICR